MKIKSLTSLGVQDTYSPEMAEPYHNYILSSGIIHKNSHSISYCLWSYRSLWIKHYFPEEWWASVLARCKNEKVERYVKAARSEGTQITSVNIARLTKLPVANSGKYAINGTNQVSLGLVNIKGVGEKLSTECGDAEDSQQQEYKDIDDFIDKKGKSKTLLERLIKLGSFRHLHPNVRATWVWYIHKYGTGSIRYEPKEFSEWKDLNSSNKSPLIKEVKVTDIKQLHKQLLLDKDGWTPKKIEEERKRQIAEYTKIYPKRKKIPVKLEKWEPDPNPTRERIMSLYTNDYSLKQMLEFEKEYYGYYWHSLCDLYHHYEIYTIDRAKQGGATVDCVITQRVVGKTSKGSDMLKLIVTDGTSEAMVILWSNDIENNNKNPKTGKSTGKYASWLQPDVGIRLYVNYDKMRGTFTLVRGSKIEPLIYKEQWEAAEDGGLLEEDQSVLD